jgi:hypothetical protein
MSGIEGAGEVDPKIGVEFSPGPIYVRKLIWFPFCFLFFSLHIKIIYKVGAIGDQNGQFRLDKG